MCADKWPSTPAEVRDFVGPDFLSMKPGVPGEVDGSDLYTLNAQDLLSAFADWQVSNGPDVAALVRRLRDALAECVDDSFAQLTDHLAKYGEAYKPARLAGLRKTVTEAKAALAEADEFLAQEDAK